MLLPLISVAQPTIDYGFNVSDDSPQSSAATVTQEYAIRYAAAGVALLYTIGFMITSIHVGRYAVTSIDLLRIRYIAAAASFVVLTLVPMGFAILGSSFIESRLWPGTNQLRWWQRTASVAAYIAATTFVAGWLWTHIMRQLAVDRAIATSPNSYVYFGTAVTFGLILVFLFKESTFDRTPGGLSSVGAVLVIVLGLVVVYSAAVYPEISPSLGGGGVWEVRIVTAGPADDQSASFKGAVIDRDGDYLHLVHCPAERSESSLEAMSIPHGEIRRISTVQQSTVKRFHQSCWPTLRLPSARPPPMLLPQ